MSAYDIARDLSVGILTYFGATKCVSHMVGDNPYGKPLPWKVLAHFLPVRIFEDGFFTSTKITTVATTVQNTTAAHETPYVWAREFLEDLGFNLTERVPAILGVYEIPGVVYRHDFSATRAVSAVPPHLIHEFSLNWTFTLIGNIFQFLVKTLGELDLVDLAWLLVLVSVLVLLCLWRHYAVLLLSRVWEELKEDVATFVEQKLYNASNELPASTITISATDMEILKTSANALIKRHKDLRTEMEILKTSANALEKRNNYLRMSKFNFDRGRTGIVFNLNTSRKLQKQLAEARMALEEEKPSYQETKDFLDHQTNARADAEEELEKLRASLETEEREEEENPQLDTIDGPEEESSAADETSSQPNPEEEDTNLSNQPIVSEQSEEEAHADQMDSQADLDDECPSSSTQLEDTEKSEEESPVDGIDSQPDVEEDNPRLSTPLETFQESEEFLSEQTDAQDGLAAEDENNANNPEVERLQTQLRVEQANYSFVFKKKEIFRHGGKKLKEKLKDLQARYNVLEDRRDTLQETLEALESQADVQAFRALRAQRDSDNAHNERRIEALQTQLGFETNNREEAQNVARQLRESLKKLKDELKEANAKYENLQISYEELDNMHGAEERANEEKDEEITDLKDEYDRLEAEFSDLNERYDELNAERNGTAETAAGETATVEDEDRSQQNEAAILQQPEEPNNTNTEEATPLRRVQSAPLWLPLPHHGDTFDPLYDVSDYGDDDCDHQDGDEDRGDDQGHRDDTFDPLYDVSDYGDNDRDHQDGDEDSGEDQGHRDGKHNSGTDDSDGPGEDDMDDDDNPDDGRNGSAAKVANDADLVPDDPVAGSPGLSKDTTSPELPLNNGQRPIDLPIPEPSPQRASFNMNGPASELDPSTGPILNVPPILPTHQAYFASLVGTVTPAPGPPAVVPAKLPIKSARKPGEPLPTYSPAPKAAGSGEAKNAHVRKLNEEVMKKAWRRPSGMPDTDEEVILTPEDEREIDGMFQRQIIQAYIPILALPTFPPSYNDIINAPEMTSVRRTISAPEAGDFGQQGDKKDEEAHASEEDYGTASEVPLEEDIHSSTSPQNPLSQTHRERAVAHEPSTSLPSEANGKPYIYEDASQVSGEDLSENASKTSNVAIEAPKNAVTSGPDSSAKPEADEKSGDGGEGSDVVDEDHEEEDDGAPMLGNYKVTRSPKPGKNDSKKPTLDKYMGIGVEASASSRSGMARIGEESGANGGWTDVEREEEGGEEGEKDEDEGEEDQGGDAIPEGTRAPPPGPPKFSDLPKPQPLPGSPTGPRGHTSQNPSPERSDSGIQTELEDPHTTLMVRLPTPRMRLPPQPKESQALPPSINPTSCPSTQGELEDGPDTQAERSRTQHARAFDPPSRLPYRGSPLRNEIGAAPFKKNGGGTQPRNAASPPRTTFGNGSWSPRGIGRGGQSGRGEQGGRGGRTPQKQNPTRGPVANSPTATPREAEAEDDFKILGASRRRAMNQPLAQPAPAQSLSVNEPTTPAAWNGNQSPGVNVRSRGAGHAGRDGRGQGGQKTPTRQPGPARGSRSANGVNSSFQRLQENLAKQAAEEAKKKQK